MSAPAAASGPPKRSGLIEVGKITSRREVVERQVVQLRRVENVRADVVRAQTAAFSAVSGRRTEIVEQREGGVRSFRGV